MAQRWSFEEDYIICKFAYKYVRFRYLDLELEQLILGLKERGFVSRSRNAVEKRIVVYQQLFSEENCDNATRQMAAIAAAYKNRVCYDCSECVEAFLHESNILDTAEDYVDNLYEFANTHVGLHHLVDIGEAGMTFKELLRYYIDRSGKTDADIYHAAFVSRDKFNHIINGRKGKKVKKISRAEEDFKVNASPKTVMQLCLGLKLNYDEAIKLMSSAGYSFRDSETIDRVVIYFLRRGNYDIFEVNEELYDRNLPVFG
jgi:hypothetical protein